MAMQRWEYRVVEGEAGEEHLNTLGDEGWELVGFTASAGSLRAYLKRPALPFKEQVTLEQRQKYARLDGYRFEGASGQAPEELP